MAVSATPVSLDPEFGASLESWELPVFIYEYLLCYNFKKDADGVGEPQFEPPYEPRLAERVESSNDGKTLTFHLRKGVKSEFGNEFTAADVKWSWDRTFALNTAGMWMMKSSSIPSARFDSCRRTLRARGQTCRTEHTLADGTGDVVEQPGHLRLDGGQEACDRRRSLGKRVAWEE